MLRPAMALMLLAAATAGAEAAEPCAACGDCEPRAALRSNLLYDAAATPSLGVELGLTRRLSATADGVFAWWSRRSSNYFWRIYGGRLEGRVWLGKRQRALTGHHLGVYGSMYSFDFELGGTGYQSPRLTYGMGLSYGYSLRIADRLNLDLGISAGYSAGRQIKYRPECGSYVSTRRSFHRYWGVTAVEISLVWFPGRGKNNHPDYL